MKHCENYQNVTLTQRLEVSKWGRKNGTHRLAQYRVATDLQSVKNAVSVKHNKAMCNTTKYACIVFKPSLTRWAVLPEKTTCSLQQHSEACRDHRILNHSLDERWKKNATYMTSLTSPWVDKMIYRWKSHAKKTLEYMSAWCVNRMAIATDTYV